MSAHKWAEVIKAWADRKTVQYRLSSNDEWFDYVSYNLPDFDDALLEWRIKPERWYRVAHMENEDGCWIYSTTREVNETSVEGHREFVRWLTDRVYY